ncbi:hypothetical protein MIDIC_60017 [Alphaproteobacteria bacterium]
MINEIGEIQGIQPTSGNVDDRVPVPSITKRLTGLLFGDKWYIKKELFEALHNRGLKLVTGIKKGMQNALMHLFEKILLRNVRLSKLFFLYSKVDSSSNILDIAPFGIGCKHILFSLPAYCLKTSKPSISFSVLIHS